MVRRFSTVAIVVAAFFVLAVPAFAFNGYRADFNVSSDCAVCHTNTAGIPQVYSMWSGTKHAVADADSQHTRLPNSMCAGCHTANWDPSKVIPVATATSAAGVVTWAAGNGVPTDPQATGNAPSSELDVGCSSCHENETAAHAGTPANPSNLANAAICGQCHSRYSYTVDTYAITPLPYAKVTLPLPGTPILPNPNPTSLLQPQMAIGFETMGNAANGWTPEALSTKLNVPFPSWTPTPNPAATTAAGLMQYWKLDGQDTPWVVNGHDGSATQYTDWSGGADKHAQALADLKADMGPNPPAECLQCHSTDYRIAPDNAKPTGDQTKYGITCVGCHTPHDKGTATGVWNEEFTPQLITDGQKTLCVTCHQDEDIAVTGVAKAGAEVHHPMKQMMDGVGAIDVPQGSPSVHKGKCVQCHMPPTTLSRGDIQLGANHTFKIIEPDVAAAVTPVPLRTTTPVPTAAPVVENITMPYSACSTCHSRPDDPDATWLQNTLDDRQAAMHNWDDQVTSALSAAAKRLGFKGANRATQIANANAALNAIKDKGGKWNAAQLKSQRSFTNKMYVVSEGSWGIHNWDYARTVILKALDEARAVTATSVINIKASPRSVKMKKTVKFTGKVTTSTTGKVTIQVKSGKSWKKTAKPVSLKGAGTYSVSIKMTKKGTFHFRAVFPANAKQRGGTSASIKVVVKK